MKKKILKLITAWALILCMTVPTMLSVQAESDGVGDAIDKETFVVQYHSHIDDFRSDENTAPATPTGYSDYLFAGWYADEDCEKACDDSAVNGEAYAKYVHKDVLGVKAQVLSGTYFATDTSDIRFVSTVDSLDYKEVGFNIKMYGTTEQYYTEEVSQKISAMGSGEVVLEEYTPDLFHETSEYFYACTVAGVTNDAFDYGIQVQPFWVTCDGTTVTADTVTKSVSNGYMNKAMDADVTEVGTLTLDEGYALKGGSLGGKYYYLTTSNAADTTVYRLAQNAEGTGWNTTEVKSADHTEITASDITYNGTAGKLVMVDGTAVSYVDRTALTALDDDSATVEFDVASIKYNKNHDKYVAMLAGGNVKVLTSDFAATGVETTVPTDLSEYTEQSVTADDSYIFQAFSKDTDGVISNKIAVYDWSGKYVATIVVALTDKIIETIDINKNTISAACTTDAGVVIYDIDILKTYTITYKNIDGDTIVGQSGYTKNSGEINVTAPTRYGYEFLGWSEETVSLSDVTWRDGLAKETDGNDFKEWGDAESTEGLYLAAGLNHTLMYGGETYQISLSALRWRLFSDDTLKVTTSAGTYTKSSFTHESYPYAVLALQYPTKVELDKLSIKSEFVKPQTMTYTIDETEETYVFDNWTKGFINTESAWSVSYDKTNYPNAIYSDEIELKAGVTYTIADYDGAEGKIRWRIITKNDAGVVAEVSDAKVYTDEYTPTGDCIVRVMMLDGRVDYNDAVIKAGSTGDRTYTASWIRKSFKVQYDANGGEGTMEDSIHEFEDDKQLSANAFTRDGYGFVGWSTSPEGEVVYADQEAVKNLTTDESITLYAQWSQIYAVEYNYDYGDLEEGVTNPETYTMLTETFTLNTPTRDGFEFAGWEETIRLGGSWHTGKVDVSGNIDTTQTGQSYSELIYLQAGRTYTIDVGTATDDFNNSTLRWRVYDLEGVYTGHKAQQTFTPDSNCYVRIWMQNVDVSSTEDGNDATITSNTLSNNEPTVLSVDEGTTGNRLYTALWNYTITYEYGEGALTEGATNPSSYTRVTEDFTLTTPTREGYTFAGWTETINLTEDAWLSGTIDEETGVITNSATRYYSNLIYLQEGRTYTFVYPESYTASETSKYIRWRKYDTDFNNPTFVYQATGAGGLTYTPTTDCYVSILLLQSSTPDIRKQMAITSTASEITVQKGTIGNMTYKANWTQNATE